MLNEPTKKAIVTEAPKQLAISLRLNVDKYQTYNQMAVEVIKVVNQESPNHPAYVHVDGTEKNTQNGTYVDTSAGRRHKRGTTAGKASCHIMALGRQGNKRIPL